MDYTILAAELQQPQYAEMSDQQAADALNAMTQQAIRQLPIAELYGYAISVSLYVRLKTAIKTTTTPPQFAAVCEAMLDLMNAPAMGVDKVTILNTDGSEYGPTANMLNAIQAGGLMTAGEREAIHALCMTTTSRAAQLGLETVGDGHVRSAREMINGAS